jgi:hypothetical protein
VWWGTYAVLRVFLLPINRGRHIMERALATQHTYLIALLWSSLLTAVAWRMNSGVSSS